MQEQGVAQFTAHDLRTSAATGLARLGSGSVVDDILNHKQKGITRRVCFVWNDNNAQKVEIVDYH